MGTPDPKLFPPPGTVPNSAAVTPLNQVQAAPVIASQSATPSLAALMGNPTVQPVTQTAPTAERTGARTMSKDEWRDIFGSINPMFRLVK